MKHLLYPPEWKVIARQIKEACDWRCLACDKQCRRPGEFYLGWDFELTVSHYDGDYHSSEIYCVAMCARCHFKHDAPFVWESRRRIDRLRQVIAGQLDMFVAGRETGY